MIVKEAWDFSPCFLSWHMQSLPADGALVVCRFLSTHNTNIPTSVSNGNYRSEMMFELCQIFAAATLSMLEMSTCNSGWGGHHRRGRTIAPTWSTIRRGSRPATFVLLCANPELFIARVLSTSWVVLKHLNCQLLSKLMEWDDLLLIQVPFSSLHPAFTTFKIHVVCNNHCYCFSMSHTRMPVFPSSVPHSAGLNKMVKSINNIVAAKVKTTLLADTE
jgi:hypothetical protein